MVKSARKVYPYSAEYGARLRKIRKEQRLSGKEMARRIGISPQHLSQIERGLTNIKLEVLAPLIKALQVSFGALDEEDKSQDEHERQRQARIQQVRTWLDQRRPILVRTLEQTKHELETLSL